MDISKIIVPAKGAFYSPVELDEANAQLVPNLKQRIHARNFIQPGFQFDFEYLKEKEYSKGCNEQKNALLKETVTRLNKIVLENEADYILVSNVIVNEPSAHFYGVKGKAKLLYIISSTTF